VCPGCPNDVHTECGLEDTDKLGVALLEKNRVTCRRSLENPGSNTGGGAADTRNHSVASKSIVSTTSRKPRASAEPVARKVPPAKASMPAAKKRRTSNGGSNDLRQIFANFRQLGEERYRGARGDKEQTHFACYCIYCEKAYEEAKADARPNQSIVSGVYHNSLARGLNCDELITNHSLFFLHCM
jgi:hypothetical protein